MTVDTLRYVYVHITVFALKSKCCRGLQPFWLSFQRHLAPLGSGHSSSYAVVAVAAQAAAPPVVRASRAKISPRAFDRNVSKQKVLAGVYGSAQAHVARLISLRLLSMTLSDHQLGFHGAHPERQALMCEEDRV